MDKGFLKGLVFAFITLVLIGVAALFAYIEKAEPAVGFGILAFFGMLGIAVAFDIIE